MAKKSDKAESTELQTQGTTAIEAFDYGEDAVPVGQVAPGYENQTNEDTAIPFITLLQANSPVVVEQRVEGAMAGMWYNTVTGQLWKNPAGLLFIPSATRHEYTEYVPRDAGGGIVGRHAIDSEVVARAKAASKEFGEYFVGENELVEQFYVFGVACDMERPIGMAVIPFKSSGIKCYKNWMTQIRSHTVNSPRGKVMPPMYSHLAKLTSEIKKKNNDSYWSPVFAPGLGSVANSLLAPDDERFLMAKACKQMMDLGTAKVNYDQQNQSGAEGGAGPQGRSAF